MSFVEERLPDLIALDAVGGPRFLTDVGTSLSGYERRADFWDIERGQWDLGYANRNEAETLALIAFFNAVACGRLHGFRFKDRQTVDGYTGAGEFLGVGDGLTDTFQLRKLYTVADETSTRPITKPVPGTVRLAVDGVYVESFTVDTTTGLVTLAEAPGEGQPVHAWYEFDVPVRFDSDWLDLLLIEPGLYGWNSVTLVELRPEDDA
jgi:uncharacterized protein (TIGR02217 family)